jgi:hypothetical protein
MTTPAGRAEFAKAGIRNAPGVESNAIDLL